MNLLGGLTRLSRRLDGLREGTKVGQVGGYLWDKEEWVETEVPFRNAVLFVSHFNCDIVRSYNIPMTVVVIISRPIL